MQSLSIKSSVSQFLLIRDLRSWFTISREICIAKSSPPNPLLTHAKDRRASTAPRFLSRVLSASDRVHDFLPCMTCMLQSQMRAISIACMNFNQCVICVLESQSRAWIFDCTSIFLVHPHVHGARYLSREISRIVFSEKSSSKNTLLKMGYSSVAQLLACVYIPACMFIPFSENTLPFLKSPFHSRQKIFFITSLVPSMFSLFFLASWPFFSKLYWHWHLDPYSNSISDVRRWNEVLKC